MDTELTVTEGVYRVRQRRCDDEFLVLGYRTEVGFIIKSPILEDIASVGQFRHEQKAAGIDTKGWLVFKITPVNIIKERTEIDDRLSGFVEF